jgi:hypothetical protein
LSDFGETLAIRIHHPVCRVSFCAGALARILHEGDDNL